MPFAGDTYLKYGKEQYRNRPLATKLFEVGAMFSVRSRYPKTSYVGCSMSELDAPGNRDQVCYELYGG